MLMMLLFISKIVLKYMSNTKFEEDTLVMKTTIRTSMCENIVIPRNLLIATKKIKPSNLGRDLFWCDSFEHLLYFIWTRL